MAAALERTFSSQLKQLAHRLAAQERVRLETLNGVFQGRALYLLITLLALPFLIPVSVPLMSTAVGGFIVLSGLRIALRRKTTLPRKLADKEIAVGFLPKVIGAAVRVTGWLERLARPRLVFPRQLRQFHRLSGLMIVVAGLLLMIPIPIPFTNAFPALAIILFATGSLHRDGLCFIGGCLMIVATCTYFGVLWYGATAATDWALQ